jgi:hypothetical protein
MALLSYNNWPSRLSWQPRAGPARRGRQHRSEVELSPRETIGNNAQEHRWVDDGPSRFVR